MIESVFPSPPSISRSLHLWSGLGDSRIEQMHSDTSMGVGPKLRRTVYNHANIANAMTGNRIRILNFGVSGDRTDQILARLPASIQSGAGVQYIHCGVNNIAQAPYTRSDNGKSVSASIVANETLSDITLMVDTSLAAGMIVVLTLDPGSTGINGTNLDQLSQLNMGLRALARTRPNVWLFDLPSAVRNPLGNLGGISFRDGFYLNEGGTLTHEATSGAFAGGKALATIINAIVPVLPRHYVDGSENETPEQLFYNPNFVQLSGGFPIGWSYQQFGQATATYSVAARADGRGNELVVDYTFSAVGDGLRFFADMPAAKYSAGDVLAILSEITVVSGSTGLAAAYPFIELNYNAGVSLVTSGCAGDGSRGAMPTNQDIVLQDATESLTIPQFTQTNYLSGSPLWLTASGAGSGTVRLLMPAFRKIHA